MEYTATLYLSLFFFAFVITLILTPLVTRYAVKANVLDRPGSHKIHDKAKPLLGGVSIFISFAAVMLFLLPVNGKLIWLIGGVVILVITGLLDDIYTLKPPAKLAGQVLAAALVVLGDLGLYRWLIRYLGLFDVPVYITVILIIGWIVLMINAFNLIDGMDGLAVGVAAIIFLAMAALSAIDGGRANLLGVQLIGAGACLGFLIFNFYPARIFMGDTGSMMLGFILAATHLFTIRIPVDGQIILGSMFIFAYPALDIAYAIYRRAYYRRSLFKADKGHIHHVFLSLGYSVRKTVLIIYGANIGFSLIAILIFTLDIKVRYLLVISVVLGIAIILLFRQLLLISSRNGISLK